MDQFLLIAASLDSLVETSDHMYREYAGAPSDKSRAWTETVDYDGKLENQTGIPKPLFGAYADAEFKLHLLNDLVRSFNLLIVKTEVNFGEMVVARSVIETAARIHWGLAKDDDYRERASRWLREWLRIIGGVKKLGGDPRAFADELGNEAKIKEGAARAGLNVPGVPPGAIDLVWLLMSAAPGPLQLQGLKREDVAAVFYRTLSAPTHGSSLGIHTYIPVPGTDTISRSTLSNPSELLTLIAGVLTAYSNAHDALTDLYGWDPSPMMTATAETAEIVGTAYSMIIE